MDWLEEELRSALARKEPPAGFKGRVMRRAGERPAAQWPRWLAAAAAAIVVVTGIGLGYRQHRGAEAKEQVMLAFKITAAKVNHIQARVKEVGR